MLYTSGSILAQISFCGNVGGRGILVLDVALQQEQNVERARKVLL